MSSKSERLNKLIAYFANGNKAEFARNLSISPQNLNSWLRNEYIDFEKVYFALPCVSAEWLLSGNGKMVKETANDNKIIPVLSDEALLQGNWNNTQSSIVVRTLNFPYDFIATMPNQDLEFVGIDKGALLYCQRVGAEELARSYLYIIQTGISGIYFVEYMGMENSVLQFMTRRRKGYPDLHLSIPSTDISQCAKIVVYTKEYDPF